MKGTSEIKSILEVFSRLRSRGYNNYTLFSDWVDLMLYALMGNDPEYLKIVGRYRNDQPKGERDIDLFCDAFAELQLAMRKTNQDMLGEIYQQLSINNKQFAQFFTPAHVCDLMAEITIGDKVQNKTVSDPCVGSGRMFISAQKVASGLTFFGQDKDLICVKMTALNICFFNANSQIAWGDSLTFECQKAYETRRSPLGGSIREIDPASITWIKKPKVSRQTTLFDLAA
ncbi:MAG: N-6 DNA methylase [Desulfuromonadales bacterium]|nr:N-6 DNA methylase [Desulfuromonadales bacterium]